MAPKDKKTSKGHTLKISKWYKADDEPEHFVRHQRTIHKASTAGKTITPGSVVILLAGRFRGRRVVVLNTLKSGLLLVTGPHKINGVPLKRVNPAYVIPTRTKVTLGALNVSDIDDTYFAKTKVSKPKKSEQSFFATSTEKTEDQKKADEEKLKNKK